MINYTYSNYELKTISSENLENVIIEIKYTYTGISDEGISSSYPGRTILPEPNAEDFKEFSDITEEEVISWLNSHADIDTMRSAIQEHISQQSGNIYKGDDLPWIEKEVDSNLE
jgi:hypothetical protein